MLSPDITEILTDPDIGGGLPFTVIRTTVTRSLAGETSSTQQYKCVGNIQPAQAEDLQQLSDEDRKETVIVIRSTFHFQLGSDGNGVYTTPDEVSFDGHRYKVNRVDDWHSWGFCTAWAVLRKDVNE